MSTAPSIRSPTSFPVRSTKNVSGNPRTPHLPTVEPLPVVDDGVRDPVATHEPPGVLPEVVHVDAEHHEPLVTVALVGLLQHGCLVAARDAPRRPEVDDDRLAAQVGDRELPFLVEAVERERRRAHELPLRELVGGARLVPERDLPDEEPEEGGDSEERDRLPDALDRPCPPSAVTPTR